MCESIPSTAAMLAWQQLKDRLPVLQRRAIQLREQLQSVDSRLEEQRQTVTGEQADVDRLNGRSLSNYLLDLTRLKDKRLQKEKQELIQARRELDELIQEQALLQQNLADLEQQIKVSQEAERNWSIGRQALIDWTERFENQSLAKSYRQIQDQLKQQQSLMTEIKQARNVAERAAATAASMLDQLDSAESWGTFDVWFKGGIITHAAKYSHIDATSALMNQLTIQLNNLRSELADIQMTGDFPMNEYSSGTRALDYFFDNIFTDLSVRDRIRDDQASVRQINEQISRLQWELDSRVSALQTSINRLFADQEKILLKINTEIG